MKSNWLKIIITFVIIYALFILIPGYKQLNSSISLIPTQWWLISLLFIVISHLFVSLRWAYFLNLTNYKLTFFQSLKIYLAGLSLIGSPARAGEAIRSLWLFKRHNIPKSIGISITIFERLSDLFSALILMILATGNTNLTVFILIMICLLFLIFIKLLDLSKTQRFIYKIYVLIAGLIPFSSKLTLTKNSSFFLSSIYAQLKSFRRLQSFVISNLLCSIAWLTESLLLYIIFYFLNVNIEFNQSVLIRTSMAIGGAISFLPAGLITSETTSISLALAYGSGRTEAFIATLFIRIYTLIIPSIIGVLAMLLQKDLNSTMKNKNT